MALASCQGNACGETAIERARQKRIEVHPHASACGHRHAAPANGCSAAPCMHAPTPRLLHVQLSDGINAGACISLQAPARSQKRLDTLLGTFTQHNGMGRRGTCPMRIACEDVHLCMHPHRVPSYKALGYHYTDVPLAGQYAYFATCMPTHQSLCGRHVQENRRKMMETGLLQATQNLAKAVRWAKGCLHNMVGVKEGRGVRSNLLEAKTSWVEKVGGDDMRGRNGEWQGHHRWRKWVTRT